MQGEGKGKAIFSWLLELWTEGFFLPKVEVGICSWQVVKKKPSLEEHFRNLANGPWYWGLKQDRILWAGVEKSNGLIPF